MVNGSARENRRFRMQFAVFLLQLFKMVIPLAFCSSVMSAAVSNG
jgi:hypothetical protein